MKEKEKESKLPSPMAILSGKSSPKKGDKDKKPKPKFKRTELLHHDDGTQTVNMDPSEAGGQSASFSRPSLEEALSAIKERHSLVADEAAATPQA